ncbi:hypothetical protein ElyMa_000041200 [Elysia marginata]|uniref:Uncharacterized protein n=1 Tax=Elysia marginata TaxID=1093978 RepID=A0AAV4EDR6_9GAST|nr:hypothetical protein ElyMa_000041200 [Elysia marginata]
MHSSDKSSEREEYRDSPTNQIYREQADEEDEEGANVPREEAGPFIIQQGNEPPCCISAGELNKFKPAGQIVQNRGNWNVCRFACQPSSRTTTAPDKDNEEGPLQDRAFRIMS